MTYLTFWHYLIFLLLIALFVGSVYYTLRYKDFEKNKPSVIFTFALLTLALMFMASLAIDSYTKEVKLLKFKHRRFYATEQIFYEGIIRNTGNYTVAKVELEIKIINKDTGHQEGRPKYETTVFETFFGRNEKDHRTPVVIMRQTIATDLLPGQTRQFHIAMDYPTYFKGFSVYPRIFAR